jgi:hypothetical protein
MTLFLHQNWFSNGKWGVVQPLIGVGGGWVGVKAFQSAILYLDLATYQKFHKVTLGSTEVVQVSVFLMFLQLQASF